MNGRYYLCLREMPLFAGLDRDHFRLICQATNRHVLRKGEHLFKQGDLAESVYIIKQGTFKIVRVTETGEEAIVQIIGPGELIAETGLFQKDTTHLATAVALEDSKACGIDRATFKKVIQDNPDLAWQIIENLNNRLYGALEQISELNTLTTRDKVLGLFVRLAKQHGEPCPKGTRINLSLTQQEIAGLIGATRVMVSRALHELTAERFLERDRKCYILYDRCF